MRTPGKEVEIFLNAAILISKYLFPQKLEQVSAVAAVFHSASDLLNVLRGNVSGAISNLLGASHHQSLPFLNGLNVERGIHERLVRASIQPCHAASHYYYFQLSSVQVSPVDIRDLEFAARTGLQRFRNLYNLVIVEIETGHGVTRFCLFRLFLDT